MMIYHYYQLFKVQKHVYIHIVIILYYIIILRVLIPVTPD